MNEMLEYAIVIFIVAIFIYLVAVFGCALGSSKGFKNAIKKDAWELKCIFGSI